MTYKIKEARIKAGLTQKELSEKSGVSRSLINSIETGKRTITSTRTLARIADALNVSVGDIFFND